MQLPFNPAEGFANPFGFLKISYGIHAKVTALILMSVLYLSCLSQEAPKIPERAQKLDNLTVYSVEADPAGEIQFVREQTFGSTNGVMIGRLGSVTVDKAGRVLIADLDQQIINVFESDGQYFTQFGGEGRGPGEFLAGPNLEIVSNRLYAYDYMQLRVSVFSPVSLSLSYTLNLNPRNKNSIEALTGHHMSWILFRNDDTFLACFSQPLYTDPGKPEYNLEDEKYIRCYLMNVEGRITDDKILKVRDTRYLTGAVKRGDFSIGVFRHFASRPLLTLSEEDQIYSAWSEDFLIKMYDSKGKYLRAWYYPYQNVRLTRENAILKANSEYSKNVITRNLDALPETWPALNSMQIDDDNRLWVSTIVEDFDIYEWWVLEETGELITRFEWPRDEPIEVVKNGYMYTRETDEETGLQQVVKYRIEFEGG